MTFSGGRLSDDIVALVIKDPGLSRPGYADPGEMARSA
jgi:hypothetical protein